MTHDAKALTRRVNEPCAKVEIVFARGSGEQVNEVDGEARRFIAQLTNRIKAPATSHPYELGTESYGGYTYPATDVGNLWNGNALGAAITAGYGNNYGLSVFNGTGELYHYLTERYHKCKSSGSYYILGGYSQGAQVVGQTLLVLPTEIRDRILYTGLFGDPKLFYPEGIGYALGPIKIAPACFGIKSQYRRGPIVDCYLYEGSLGPRIPYLSPDMMGKTGLWCNKDDFICGTSQNPFASGHSTYKKSGNAIDQAAQEAASKLDAALKKENPQTNYNSLINVKTIFGTGLNGQNVIFLVDASTLTDTQLAQARQYLKNTVQKIAAKGNYFGMYVYRGSTGGGGNNGGGGGDGVADIFTATSPLTKDANAFLSSGFIDQFVNKAPSATRSNYPLSLLDDALRQFNWHNGAAKSAIMVTGSPTPGSNTPPMGGGGAGPMPGGGFGGTGIGGIGGGIGGGSPIPTVADIARKALAIDPVNIYPVVSQEYAAAYEELADKTSGQITSFTDDTGLEAAGDIAFAKTQDRPVPFLGNIEYIADPGQEITFDASDSYMIDGTIDRYEWDFDGDSIFEATTTTPSINYAYSEVGDYLMQVRVTASNGLVANASATVHIGTYIPPALPQSPTNLQVKVITTIDNKSTVRLTWDPLDNDGFTTGLALRVNGIMLGTLTSDRTSIDITDVDRSIDVDFGIAGFTEDQMVGPGAFVTLAKPEPASKENPAFTAAATIVNPDGDYKNIVASAAQTGGSGNFGSSVSEQAHANSASSKKPKKDDKQTTSAAPWLSLPASALIASGVLWRVSKRVRGKRRNREEFLG